MQHYNLQEIYTYFKIPYQPLFRKCPQLPMIFKVGYYINILKKALKHSVVD